jgi:hypothetical protein
MQTFVLTDVTRDLSIERFERNPQNLGVTSTQPFSVTKRTLRGGRREGVELIDVNNGVLSFSVIPTRGMGIWKASCGGDRVGWDSPVADGPVNPAFVNLMNWGGLGWLEGFDELLARCGLENNGAPYSEKSVGADGSERHTVYGLHGKIANIPASYVAVEIGDEAPHELAVVGHVHEAKLFAPQIRMITRISTTAGSNWVRVRDEFVNLKDTPGEMQVLYHWNLGAPHLEAGARFVAPARTMAPRDRRAVEGIDHFELYGPPEPGFAEQVYLFDLLAAQDGGRTLAMLRNRAGDKGVVLRFSRDQLPCFTLWKCTGGLNEGYVTGLEPATNYPNPKAFERARNRVITLPPGGRYLVETVLEVLTTRAAVTAVEAEVETLQKQAGPAIHRNPVEPFGPVG